MFSRTSKSKVFLKQLEIIERSLLLNGFEGLERNSIWALDQSARQMVQPMLKEAKNFRGSRCTAPQRAALQPRVDAAFKMYVGVVNESNLRGLADWRKLEKELWPGRDEAYEEADGQDDDQSMEDEMEDDVKMRHAQPVPSARAQTVPSNYGASFNQANLAQQFVPFQSGRLFPAHLQTTGRFSSSITS